MSRRPDAGDGSREEDQNLEALVAELAGTLETLQAELDDGGRGPQPPRAGDVVRFTEQYTIPTIISVLEASIRSLELLRGALRLADGQLEETDPREGRSRDRRSRGARALDAVDGLLGDLDGAVEGRPVDPEARDLLAEARSLREEIDDRISSRSPGRERTRRASTPHSGTGPRERTAGDSSGGAVRIDVTDADPDPADCSGATPRESRGEESRARGSVDVEAELDAIKREVRDDEAETEEGNAADEREDD